MTPTGPPNRPTNHEGDERDPVAQLHHALVDDLAATLHLDAGAAEATQAHHHARLTADLRATLNFEAGLAAIIGAPGPPDAAVPPLRPEVAVVGPSPGSWVTQFADHLEQLDPRDRLALRTDRIGRAVERALALSSTLDDIAARASDLTRGAHDQADPDGSRAQGRPRAQVIARGLASALALVVDLAHTHTHARDLDLNRADDRARALAVDRALARARARNGDDDLALARARAIDDAFDRAHMLAHAVARDRAIDLGFDYDIYHAATTAHAYAREFAQLRALSLARSLGLRVVGTSAATMPPSMEEIRQLQRVLGQATSNFVGADLRSASLENASLEGIRWSNSTKWPTRWEEQIRAASVEVTPGVFEIRGWGGHVDERHDLTV